MKADWISVFEGDELHAKLAQAQLEGEGVPTLVPEYGASGPYPFLGPTAIGASVVLVPAQQAQRASEILAAARIDPERRSP